MDKELYVLDFHHIGNLRMCRSYISTLVISCRVKPCPDCLPGMINHCQRQIAFNTVVDAMPGSRLLSAAP